MKSIKPIVENTQATLIATDIAAELRSAIESLNTAVNNLTSQVNDVETRVDSTAVSKQSGDFDSVRVKNLNVSTKATIKEASIQDLNATNVISERVESGIVSSDDISTEELSAHDASIDNLTTEDINSNTVTTESISADDITADTANVNTTTSNTLNAVDATVSNLEVQSISNLADFTSDNLTATTKVNAPLVLTNKVLTDEIATLSAKIEELTTRNTIFNTDETDPNQFVDLTGELSYIEIPAVSSGYYRINVRNDQDGTYWAVTFINTETAPIVQYSKAHNGDIGGIYYDSITRKLYIKTYSNGRIFWSNNDKHGNLAPVVYPELPIDSSAVTTFRYGAAAQNRLVIMGDNTADFGLTVQGLLEANIIKDGTAYHQLFFYGDSWLALHTFADKYLTWEDPEYEVKHYLKSETSGYLYHKNDDYKSPDMEDCEAFEKIAYDGTNVTFTLDTKQGQDEIQVNGSSTTEVQTVDPLQVFGLYGSTVIMHELTAQRLLTEFTLSGSTYIPKSGYVAAFNPAITFVPPWGTSLKLYDENDDVTIYFNEAVKVQIDGFEPLPISNSTNVITDDYVTNEKVSDYTSAYPEADETYIFYEDGTDEPYDGYSDMRRETVYPIGLLSPTYRWFNNNVPFNAINYILSRPQEDELPFIISFSAASRPWDELMNSEVFNSYSNERQ